MSDSYQAIYDAVRSRITGGDISQAVASAINNAGIGFSADQALEAIKEVAYQYERPCVLFKPTLKLDGNKWCALFGDDLAVGVAGFGDSPAEAMFAFDAAWNAKE